MNDLPLSWFGHLGLLVPLLSVLVIAFAGYWAIRLGVRHGLLDAERRRGGPGASGASDRGPDPRP